MSVADDVRQLAERVRELAALDTKLAIFGASSHRYRFAPPLPETDLVTFERAHGFTLPDDFRLFLTTIGNGGAGPSYGVIGFRAGDAEDYTKYERLGAPFPYADDYNPIGILYGEDDTDDDDDDAADERRSAYWNAFSSDGVFYLCHHGCASRSLLVVAGPCRGEVWFDDSADDAGVGPAKSRTTGARHSFTSWYAEWLDTSFAKLRA